MIKANITHLIRLVKKNRIDRIIPKKLINFIGDTYYKKAKRPCHYKELFIQSSGDVYPCCRVWGRKDLLIGHITDQDLLNKIKNFNPRYCFCNKFSIRRSNASDIFKTNSLNLELSLACQAKCAMCCVNAPSFHGSYNYYDLIEKLIQDIGTVNNIVFQGGEILVQKKSLEFIEKLRNKYSSDVYFHLISNGNIDASYVEYVEKLFDSITISIVGFQKETYKKIMGLEIDKMISFAEKLINRNVIKVSLKYLVTPSNIHETNLFLNWALQLAPSTSIQIVEMGNFDNYINYETNDDYWRKILDRVIKDIHLELANANKFRLKENGTKITVTNLEKYKITKNFIRDHHLQGIMSEYDT